jgi:hypothetical protein
MDDPFARQMLGQRTASRPAPLERRHHHLRRHGGHLGRRVSLRRIRLQIGQLQLELIEQRTTFRGLAEPIVSKLPDRDLELLDQQRPVLCLALRRRRSQFSRTEGLALGDDERMRARKIGRKRIINAHRQRWNHKPMRLRTRNRVVIHNAAISRPPVAARSVAASANRCLPAGSRAAPMRSSRRLRSATAR